MSAQQQRGSSAASAEASGSILDLAIQHTPQTAPDRAKELIQTLTEEALRGTVTFDKNVGHTLERGIAAIDRAISKQLATVMHDPKFQKLEGSWRGLHHLVMNSETGATLGKLVIAGWPG